MFWQQRIALWIYGLVFFVALPVLVVVMVGYGTIDTIPAVRAANGVGRPGAFTVTEIDCHRVCTLFGDFVPDNGEPTLEGRQWNGWKPGGVHRGDSLRAIDSGSSAGVYPVSHSRYWVLTSLVAVLGLLLGVWWVRLILGWGRRGRYQSRKRRRITEEAFVARLKPFLPHGVDDRRGEDDQDN